jgi:4-amino-4-deoxy-L-arabinose transferase-like glycosyltransferase
MIPARAGREAATPHPAGALPYRTAPASSIRLHSRLLWWSIACALAVLWFGTLELRGLFAPDEGRYAQIPQAMLATGDWITPRLNGFKYFEKPPLQYWATAVIYKLFGEDEWTARLWPALVGFLGAGVVAWIGTVSAGRRVGGLAGFMLATSLGYFVAGQYLTLDMGLTFFLTCALAFLIEAQSAELPDRARTRWMLLVWGALACAVLSKGLVGIVLPGLALGAYMALTRDLGLLRRLAIAPGIGVLLAVSAPWFLLVQDRNPEFFRFFFIYEHFERFALPGHHRPGPWWYFIPVLLAGTLPWTPLVARAIVQAVRERGSKDRGNLNIDLLLVVWAATIFLFFSLSSSKLPAYVLPALPPLVLLAARRIGKIDAKGFVRDAAFSGALAAVAAGGACLLLERTDSFHLLAPAAPWFLFALLALLAGGAGATRRLRRAFARPRHAGGRAAGIGRRSLD